MKIALVIFGGLVILNGAYSKFSLTVLHTNDVHARFEQMNKYGSGCSESDAKAGECFGGVPRRKTKIDELRAKYSNTLLVDAGDQFQGTLWFTIFKGKAVSYFMKKLGYQAMALGNHEFDLGIDGIAQFLDNVSFPVISSNIDTSAEPRVQGKFNKSTVLTIGGQRIGIIGYTTRDTVNISSPGRLKFTDETVAIQEEVDRLKALGIDKIIALGHSGYDVDMRIASLVKGLDLIVGGHTNTFLYNGTAPSNEKPVSSYPTVVTQEDKSKVLVVQDYAFGKYLGFLQVDFDDNGVIQGWRGNPILLDNDTAQDPTLLEDMKSWQVHLESFRNTIIGRSVVFLDARRPACRLRECNLGNLICDAMIHQNLDHPDSKYWAKASIAMLNSGGVRTSINKGPISLETLSNVIPFRNTIDIVELKGKHVREVLEHSVSMWNLTVPEGRFLQVSGVHVVYDVSRPVGSRVVSVDVRCGHCDIPKLSPLDPEKTYQVLFSSFLVNGGDGFSVIKKNMLNKHTNGDLDLDVVAEYIKKMSPMATGVESRIRFVDGPQALCVSGSERLGSSWLTRWAFLVLCCYIIAKSWDMGNIHGWS